LPRSSFLPPVVLEAPFAGAPMRYRRREPKGFAVYGVGPNGRDDGGDARKETESWVWGGQKPAETDPDDPGFAIDR